MKFLVISDLHGNIDVLEKLDFEFNNVDGVLFAGDFAECFNIPTGKPALEALCKKHEVIFSVLGNCDEPSFVEELDDKDINVEKTLVYHHGIAIVGAGGGTKFTGKTPNEREESEIISDFNILNTSESDIQGSNEWDNLIIISHNPPKDTKCDAVNEDLHAGSELFRNLIEEKQPLAVVCGHIHEGRGVDSIGKTTVINPGPLCEGFYAILNICVENDNYKIESVELKQI